MAKVRIIVRPTGGINGQSWPTVGETIDLAEHVAASMVAAGHVERVEAVKVEKRPAPTAKVEKRRRGVGNGH